MCVCVLSIHINKKTQEALWRKYFSKWERTLSYIFISDRDATCTVTLLYNKRKIIINRPVRTHFVAAVLRSRSSLFLFFFSGSCFYDDEKIRLVNNICSRKKNKRSSSLLLGEGKRATVRSAELIITTRPKGFSYLSPSIPFHKIIWLHTASFWISRLIDGMGINHGSMRNPCRCRCT